MANATHPTSAHVILVGPEALAQSRPVAANLACMELALEQTHALARTVGEVQFARTQYAATTVAALKNVESVCRLLCVHATKVGLGTLAIQLTAFRSFLFSLVCPSLSDVPVVMTW